MRAWAKAITAKDADGVAAHYASDVVAFDLAPPLKTVGFNRKARKHGSILGTDRSATKSPTRTSR